MDLQKVLFVVLCCWHFSSVGQTVDSARLEGEALYEYVVARATQIGVTNTETGNPEAIDQAKRALLWAEQHGSLEEQVRAQFIYYFFLTSEGPLYEKVVLANKLWSNRKMFTVTEQARLCYHLKRTYHQAKRPKEELEVALEFYPLIDSIGFGRSENLPSSIATIYYELGQYQQANVYYRKSMALFREKGDSSNVAGMYNNLGSVYTDMQLPDAAQRAFEKAISLLQSLYDTSATVKDQYYYTYYMAFVQWNLHKVAPKGDGYTERKNQLANQLIRLGPKFREPHWAYVGYRQLGQFNYEQGAYKPAIAFYDSAMTLGAAGPFGDQEKYIELLNLKGRAYLGLGIRKTADALFERATFLTDSFQQVNAQFDATVAAAFYESREKEKELRHTKLLAETAETKRKQQQSEKMLVGAAGLGTTLLALVLFFFLRKSGKDRNRISQQKGQLEVALRDKETLIKEIHHRVKNNMQIMSGLFQLQSAHTENQEFKTLAAEGQSRIESMALVHQMLYSSPDLDNVDFKEYGTTLVKQLFLSLYHGKEVSLNIDIENEPFDLDTSISLGLIINELVTNALKYGFPDDEGILSVILKRTKQNKLLLTVSDSGKGYPHDFSPETANSLGLKLVKLLAAEIRAQLRFFNADGAHCTLEMNG